MPVQRCADSPAAAGLIHADIVNIKGFHIPQDGIPGCFLTDAEGVAGDLVVRDIHKNRRIVMLQDL